MKNTCYTIFVILLLSCANEAKRNDASIMDFEETNKVKQVHFDKLTDYESIASLKLEEYFDLLKLQQKHPDFKEDIILKLQEFSHDSLINYDISKIKSLENIKQVGNTEQLSDSVKKILLTFNITTNNTVVQDSIFAIITSKTILLDNKETTSNKITLSRKH